jgi:hypothetical protein
MVAEIAKIKIATENHVGTGKRRGIIGEGWVLKNRLPIRTTRGGEKFEKIVGL